jgi:Asp-tRNA(Asn)/Glu-tRNA(Gln) amidotransferase A subunit family amidase
MTKALTLCSLVCCLVVAVQWTNDCSPGVADVFKQTLARLEQLGATVVDVSLPDLDLVQVRSNWSKYHVTKLLHVRLDHVEAPSQACHL